MNQENRHKNLTHLKENHKVYATSPNASILESFDNLYSKNDYTITFDCPEFTSLCPVTNQPDFGHITIKYIADKKCIESKSLKLYLFSFRNHNCFHEEVVNRILADFVKVCSPRWCQVQGNFHPRGGISLQVEASYNAQK